MYVTGGDFGLDSQTVRVGGVIRVTGSHAHDEVGAGDTGSVRILSQVLIGELYAGLTIGARHECHHTYPVLLPSVTVTVPASINQQSGDRIGFSPGWFEQSGWLRAISLLGCVMGIISAPYFV